MEVYSEAFRDFIKERRKELKISRAKLCEGICNYKVYERFEKGHSNIGRNMMERVMGRLGIGSDLFIHQIRKKEYLNWESRANIIYAIRKQQYEQVDKMLAEFRKCYQEESLDEQFYYRFMAMNKQCQGAPDKEVLEYLHQAKMITMPEVTVENVDGYVLSIQEVDMLLDYLWYDSGSDNATFEKMVTYIQSGRFDDGAKARLLPKAVFYYVQKTEKETGLEQQPKERLAKCCLVCSDAIEYLRDAPLLLYLPEILSLRVRLAYILDEDDFGIYEAWNAAMARAFAQFRQQYRTLDTAILYFTKNTGCINNMIRIRRKLRGLTVAQLSELSGVDARTIFDIESGKENYQVIKAQELLAALGVPRELTKSSYDISSQAEKELMMELQAAINKMKLEQAKELYKKLKGKLGNTCIYNEQELRRSKALIDYKSGDLTNDEVIAELKKVIEMSLPLERLTEVEEIYLTKNEMKLLTNYFRRFPNDSIEKQEGFAFLEMYCRNLFGDYQEINRWNDLSLTLDTLSCAYGNQENYAKSSELAVKIAELSFLNCRMSKLPGVIYDLDWNKSQQNGTTGSKDQLNVCVMLAKLLKNKNDEKFYASKLEKNN